MADRDTTRCNSSSADGVVDRLAAFRRRTLLSGAVGVSVGATVGVGLARAATPEPGRSLRSGATPDPSTRARTAASDRHVLYREFSGFRLKDGRRDGTRWTPDGIRINHPTGSLDYVDPFAEDKTPVHYHSATWTSPVVPVPAGYTELISSWQVDTPGKTWVQIEVRGADETSTRSGWFVLGRWCAKDPADGGAIHRTSVDDQDTEVATVWTDTLHAFDGHRFSDWQLRVTLFRPDDSRETPVLRTVGAVASLLPDDPTVPVSPGGSALGTVLDVPRFSQEVHDGHYPEWDNGGEAWCSATSTAMVLKYWHTGPHGKDLDWVDPPVDAEVDYSARNVFDYTYDGAGNWPFNTAYATTWGLRAFVTRLRSFTEAEELIKAGIPVIISVSFKKDELDGAGYGTNGHLMVVVGFTEDGDVVVNDPASHLIPDNDQVRFTYRRDQLENAWVPHSGGTVYVIHSASVPLPRVLDHREPNWP
ncbi:peptidase C39 family protein [Microlunatus soli]|uniref:Peptidase_C39 like family protein n=1 Tax=Microlunatus soli TaxID=630515 RepID=A0A1H1ZWH9_9ACTN|nr:peptidase C39 family protein [Microlunatus soli]SDT37949.1 Peptidase_C39 like family protein [Microlunatus soli]